LKSAANIYSQEKLKIEKKLFRLLEGKSPKSLYEPCDYILKSSGKRLRAILVLFSAKACGLDFKDVYNASLAVEILHNFTLVHDDIMDNAEKRRGLPTLHIKYDLSTAILAGDNLIAIAYESLLKDCNGNSKKVLQTFTRGIVEVCEGQSLDKEFENRSNVTLREYLLMIQKKTAALAEMCCKLGAEISNGKKDDIKNLSAYGKNLGMAFQIQDDLLDITADEKELGKKIGGDLLEGKKTFLFLSALDKAKGKEKQKLLDVIKNKGVREEEIDNYKNLYLKLGVIDKAKEEILKYSNKALASANKIQNAEAKYLFNWLIESLINRKK
jgi:geranylgeranyl diphosphate synthase type II